MDTKSKNRFNIIDVCVILIILALIAGIVIFTVRESGEIYSERKEKNITYTVRLSGVSKDFLPSFEEEEHVLNSSTLNYIGTITKIKQEKTAVNTDKAEPVGTDGQYKVVQSHYDDVYDVYLTVSSKTTLDSRGIAYIDSQRITIGSVLYVRCGNFAATGYITNFSIS